MPKKIRVGFICPKWLPKFGGAEQYEYRLAKELIKMGFEVTVLCGTARKDGVDNGNIPVERFVPDQDLDWASWQWILGGHVPLSRGIFDHYRFFNRAIKWAEEQSIDIAIIGNTLQSTMAFHAKELYSSLKAMKIKVGCIHHDLSNNVLQSLTEDFLKQQNNWEMAANKIEKRISNFFQINEEVGAYYTIGSPLFFSPDFVISCSFWSARFIDPLNKTPMIVAHPIMDYQDLQMSAQIESKFSYRDILMINPQSRKNPKCMAHLINSSEEWTFRVLKGGWGDSFKEFTSLIKDFLMNHGDRIELLDYVEDMSYVYQSVGLVFFPSSVEGYGMAAVEPMYAGVPVVSSNYPPILEAVGQSAYTCCPYKDGLDVWQNAVKEVFDSKEFWRAKSLERAEELRKRQSQEMLELEIFLRSIL